MAEEASMLASGDAGKEAIEQAQAATSRVSAALTAAMKLITQKKAVSSGIMNKLQNVKEAVMKVADAEAPFLIGEEELPLEETLDAMKACDTASKTANMAVSICRMFIATKLVEARRFRKDPVQKRRRISRRTRLSSRCTARGCWI